MAESTVQVRHNQAAQRFEVAIDGQLALLTYQERGDRIDLQHTEVPAALEGRGIAGALAAAALGDARTRGLTVVPSCPFVASYIGRHPEFQPLVDPAWHKRPG